MPKDYSDPTQGPFGYQGTPSKNKFKGNSNPTDTIEISANTPKDRANDLSRRPGAYAQASQARQDHWNMHDSSTAARLIRESRDSGLAHPANPSYHAKHSKKNKEGKVVWPSNRGTSADHNRPMRKGKHSKPEDDM